MFDAANGFPRGSAARASAPTILSHDLMETFISTGISRAFLSAAVLVLLLSGCAAFEASNDIHFLTNGVAVANASDPPSTEAFANWCDGVCVPTTHQIVRDPASGIQKGWIFVWARNFQFGAGGSLCFSEFIVFELPAGQIHVASGDSGTCGAPIDPELKQPLFPELGATVVVAGGGDGVIVGGTGKFRSWTGTYTNRVFVGFGEQTSGIGGIVYYDQLWFRISPR